MWELCLDMNIAFNPKHLYFLPLQRKVPKNASLPEGSLHPLKALSALRPLT